MLTEQRTLMTTAEAADLLEVDLTTIQRRARRGVIPAIKLPGRTGAYVFERAVIEALVAPASASEAIAS